jgi:hypothetical protein
MNQDKYSALRVHHSSLIPSVRQHSLDAFLIAFGNYSVDIQQPFSLVCFLRQDVTSVRMAALDLASGRQAKAFRGASVCF